MECDLCHDKVDILYPFFEGDKDWICLTCRDKEDELRKKRKAKKSKKSRHHIMPTSRGGRDNSYNIAVVSEKTHEKYHALFSNLTPDEIVVYLVNYFWNGQTQWVDKSFKRLSLL